MTDIKPFRGDPFHKSNRVNWEIDPDKQLTMSFYYRIQNVYTYRVDRPRTYATFFLAQDKAFVSVLPDEGLILFYREAKHPFDRLHWQVADGFPGPDSKMPGKNTFRLRIQ